MEIHLKDGSKVIAHLTPLEIEHTLATQTIMGVGVTMMVEDGSSYRTIKVSDINVSLTLVHYKAELTSDIGWGLDEMKVG